MAFQYLLLSSSLPSLLLLFYFYKRDLNPEPAKVLLFTFSLGVLITIPVALWASLLRFEPGQVHPMLAGFYTAFFVAAGPEEFAKYKVLTGYSMKRKAFDEPMDGVVYGATASLGFATLENILYVAEGGFDVALIRAFSAVPGHACWGAIIGYYAGRARFEGQAGPPPWLGLVISILLHGLYDFPLLSIDSAVEQIKSSGADVANLLPIGVGWLLSLSVLVLVAGAVWTLLIVRRLRREQMRLDGVPD